MNKSFMALALSLAFSALSFDVIYAGPGRTGQTHKEILQLGRVAAKQAQHFQKMCLPTTARFESRHPHTSTSLYNSSKTIPALLMLLLIMPTVTTAMTMDKPSVDKPSPIYSKDYWASNSWYSGPEERTFGSCEKLADNTTFCCGIGSNYTVECCVHPDPSTMETSRGISRCLSYNLDGIVGDQPTAPLNLTAALLETKKTCPQTYHIADETKELLRPKFLQNMNGTSCSVETFETNPKINRIEETGPSCTMKLFEISQEHGISTLFDVVKKLVQKLNLPTMPKVWLFNNQMCDHYGLKAAASTLTGSYDGNITEEKGLVFPYSTLQKYSDTQLTGILGHECTHLKQDLSETTDNNIEAEADIGATLVNNNACLALFFEKESQRFEKNPPLPLSLFNSKVLSLLLEIQSDKNTHPLNEGREALILTMHEYHKRAKSLLLEDSQHQ